MYDSLLAGIRNQLQTQADSTEQISSGRRFTRPSQDGLGYKTSLDIRHVQKGIDAGLQAVSVAKLRLGSSQNALSQMQPIIQRAQVLAVQQANATLTAAERSTAATEVARLQEQLLSLSNQSFDGSPLFAGTATSTTAIALDGGGNAVYQGNTQDRVVAITSTETMTTNVRADHTAFTQAFSSIAALKTALNSNDVTAIQNSVSTLTAAGNAMAELTGEVGGKMRSVGLREQTFFDMRTQVEARLNAHESVDIAKVATQLSQSQTALQAAYAEVSRISNLSLVNYLK
jgi:flagellar hook-associated protein 3 FlgL